MTDEPKRERGRPPVHDVPRTKQVIVRVSEDEHAALSSLAASNGTTIGIWIRDRALESLGEATSPDLALELANRELDKLRALRDELDAQLAAALNRVRGN